MTSESFDSSEVPNKVQSIRKVTRLVLILLITVMSGYLALTLFLDPLSRKALDVLGREMTSIGMQTNRLSFNRVRLPRWNHLEWDDFMAGILCRKDGGAFSGRYFELRVPVLSISFISFKEKKLRVSFQKADLSFVNQGETRVGERLDIGELEAYVQLDFMNPPQFKRQVRFLMDEVTKLLSSGATQIPLKFRGMSHFELAQKQMTARLETETSGGKTLIVMNRDDLKNISEFMTEKLREDEIQVIARNTLRAPRLLQIRDKASRDARSKAQNAPGFPDDAYRHVYWSFLLTREYGEKLAEEMTDAHESGADNPEKEKRMDLNNNRVGRRYAAEEISEEDLVERVLEDPEVIRDAYAAPSAEALHPRQAMMEMERPLPSHQNTITVIENTHAQGGDGRIDARL